ncbi:MAG: rhomboid family intramembrane serine protease [Candidatus Pacearchaeota archaeon]|jgi:membrane associated rhomboid family serine protease
MAKGKFKYYFLWLCLTCIVVYIFQLIIPGFTELFILNLKAVYEHQYFRFVSAIFLHGDAAHLFYNLFALFFFGWSLEKLIGSKRFLIVFFLSGIIGNIVAVNFYPSSLGASGAIYGILGCLTIINPFMFVWAFGLILPIFLASIFWILGDIIGVFGLGASNTGYIAHLSGVGVGILFGLFFRNWKKKIKQIQEKISIPDNYIKRWEDSYMR